MSQGWEGLGGSLGPSEREQPGMLGARREEAWRAGVGNEAEGEVSIKKELGSISL